MSVIVTIRVEPIIGKFQLVESRIKKAAGICARKGAKTRFARIAMGLNAGQYLFAAAFDNFSSTMTSMEQVMGDPKYIELMLFG